MSRSHPPALLKTLERTWDREIRLGPDTPLALAVSGGPDSMALLHACHVFGRRRGFRLLALTVNHGLRREATDEVRVVLDAARSWGVESRALDLSLETGSNLQARAREARYAALWAAVEEHFGESGFLATAHHEQDRAETVLLRLLRGTSLAGLGVLRPREGRLLRPLVRVNRSAIDAHNGRHQVPFVQDPSNHDRAFLRVRVRDELLPLLRDLGPGVEGHLVALADEAGQLPEPLGLQREQRRQLRQALRSSHGAVDLPLGHGLRIVREPPREPSGPDDSG